MEACNHHLADRCVPAKLPRMMREAGYEVEFIRPLVFLDTVLRRDGLAMMLLNLMHAYAIQNDLVDEPTVRGWADEQRHVAQAPPLVSSHFRWTGRSTVSAMSFERVFGRLKDFRRVATRYDKLARNFLAGLCLSAAVAYWVNQEGKLACTYEVIR